MRASREPRAPSPSPHPLTPSHPDAAGTIIAGPFEAGFDSEIDTLLGWLGCAPASNGYLDGGIDTQTALEIVHIKCGGDALPKVVGGAFISLMWSGGVHSPPARGTGCTSPPGGLPGYSACGNPPYHFHQNFSILYNSGTASVAGHSSKVGVTTPPASLSASGIYGRFEAAGGVLPSLDACGGHFGVTPDSGGAVVYHHHVQTAPPFTVGCYGPSASNQLVTLAECRSYYDGTCGDSTISVTTAAAGTRAYDPFCPCFDSVTGTNVGNTSSTALQQESSTGVTSSSSPTLSGGAIAGIAVGAAAVIVLAAVLARHGAGGIAATAAGAPTGSKAGADAIRMHALPEGFPVTTNRLASAS